MSLPIRPPITERTGIPEALTKIIGELKKGSTLTVSDIAQKVGIDRRTVEKVIDMIIEVQGSLRNQELLKVRPMGDRGYWVFLRSGSARAREVMHSAGQRLKRKKE